MSDSVSEFVGITGAPRETAAYFLEVANNDLNRAIELFFSGDVAPPGAAVPKPTPAPPSGGRPLPGGRPSPAQPPGGRPPGGSFNSKETYEEIMKQLEASPGGGDPTEGTIEKHKVTFWKNGFQLDDGDFRSNTDPANQAFLADISRSQIPRELHKRGVEIDLEIDDKREEEFKPKPKPRDPWAGAGRNLSGGGTSAPARPPPVAQAPKAAAAAGKTNFAVEGRPSTRVQLLFPNSPKLALTVPLDATVGDLRQFAREARPDLAGRWCEFECQYPPKVLTNEAETIEAAGLKMAQIKVKLA
jgi:UBX domain-containing protein 1